MSARAFLVLTMLMVPAVAALVQIGKVEAAAALGVRALGHPEAVTTSDRWHIGSDTKAFTALD